MKNIARVSVFAGALMAVFAAHANNKQAELQVTGLIRPTICSISLGANGVAAYGDIKQSALTEGAYTWLGPKHIPFTISCNGAAKVALKVKDNRATSVVSGIGGASVPDAWLYGLGSVADKMVGSYMMFIPQNSILADSVAATEIFAGQADGPWSNTSAAISSTGNKLLGKDQIFSWAAKDTTTPLAARTVSGSITIETVVNKPENLPLSQEVPLDGSATLEVFHI